MAMPEDILFSLCPDIIYFFTLGEVKWNIIRPDSIFVTMQENRLLSLCPDIIIFDLRRNTIEHLKTRFYHRFQETQNRLFSL